VPGHEKADFSRFYLHDRPLLDKQKECGQCSSFVQHNKGKSSALILGEVYLLDIFVFTSAL